MALTLLVLKGRERGWRPDGYRKVNATTFAARNTGLGGRPMALLRDLLRRAHGGSHTRRDTGRESRPATTSRDRPRSDYLLEVSGIQVVLSLSYLKPGADFKASLVVSMVR
jgi:hypothetical protein